MTKLKTKVELLNRITALGFTFDEAQQLRRISMTLSKWAEMECGDESGRAIERAEARKLILCHDPETPDGLRVCALDYHGRIESTVKRLPAHLKQDNDPEKFPPEALSILERLQQRENGTTGKPYMTYDLGQNGKRGRYPIADREAGALKRLKAIVLARNTREAMPGDTLNLITPYHQGDPRGCALYLLKGSDLSPGYSIDQIYTRGLAVCA